MLANTILADILSALIGFSSVAFYVAAFFYPEVHRRSDIAWSGLGVFYALILWLCAGQMTLAILIGQIAVVALVCGLGWQTLTIRRQKTPVYQQTPVVITPEVVGNWAKNKVNELRIAPAEPVPLKLEKRRLSEFSADRLGQRTDPRRRPAYDYEFVEDGILDDSELEAIIEPQLSLDLTAEETPDMGIEECVPSSAIAEIISVEAISVETISVDNEATAAIEVEESQLDQAIDKTTKADALDADSHQSEPLTEGEFEGEEAKDFESFATELKDPKTDKAEASEPAEAVEPAIDRDDWGDDIFNEAPAAVETPTTSEPIALKKKPSLLATPLILVGWLKDVTTSFTQPKPAKPVIEIPRRDPSSATASPQSNPMQATEPSPIKQATEPIDSQAEADNEVNNWEESNWDD